MIRVSFFEKCCMNTLSQYVITYCIAALVAKYFQTASKVFIRHFLICHYIKENFVLKLCNCWFLLNMQHLFHPSD